MSQTIRHHLHVLEAADWKAGIITLLEPASPYRPWRYGFAEARPGDYAMLVLGTDPVSVLTVLARIDTEEWPGGAMLDLRRYRANVVDLTTLAMMLDLEDAFTSWRFDDADAERLILALHESPIHGEPSYRWGHSSVAAARNLLRFDGDCDGCGATVDLSDSDARRQVHVHTADPRLRPEPDSPIWTSARQERSHHYRISPRETVTDWPAVLCQACHNQMRGGGHTSFIEFRFATHPQCPRCGAKRTRRIQYGMPATGPDTWGPWLLMAGCCLEDEDWYCDVCEHRWW
ncbi:hypothetical protein [Mycolicibacterium sp. F2034L]|uniref:hypothetical protein n=1 Tax=Mycolicibacterium sp. F2034L TaxID=2926422 RepID=UPI001FF4B3DA|nr:hypothetical protein [Mycolicibacterium sp. F2034L]MCK0173881.1 hypothetical protein [Mycolicibacterium sp. F2034L]